MVAEEGRSVVPKSGLKRSLSVRQGKTGSCLHRFCQAIQLVPCGPHEQEFGTQAFIVLETSHDLLDQLTHALAGDREETLHLLLPAQRPVESGREDGQGGVGICQYPKNVTGGMGPIGGNDGFLGVRRQRLY